MSPCLHLKFDSDSDLLVILYIHTYIYIFLYIPEQLILKFVIKGLHPDITNVKVNTC